MHTLIFEFWKESLEKTGFSREIDRGSSLSISLKYGIWCGPVSTAKLFNSTEYLASEAFSCVASLNSPNIFYLTRNTNYSPFTYPVFRIRFEIEAYEQPLQGYYSLEGQAVYFRSVSTLDLVVNSCNQEKKFEYFSSNLHFTIKCSYIITTYLLL